MPAQVSYKASGHPVVPTRQRADCPFTESGHRGSQTQLLAVEAWRLALLDATDTELSKIITAVVAGRLAGAGKIGVRVGKVIGRYKMAKHYILDIVRHEALLNRAVVKGHRLRRVAASRKKLRAA